MEAEVRALSWKRAKWAWKIFKARRAEDNGEWEIGVRLLDEAAQIKALWPQERVLRAKLLLGSKRTSEAQSSFVALWNEFEFSDSADCQYLRRYCAAILAPIWGNAASLAEDGKQKSLTVYDGLLRVRFPIPDHHLCPLPSDEPSQAT